MHAPLLIIAAGAVALTLAAGATPATPPTAANVGLRITVTSSAPAPGYHGLTPPDNHRFLVVATTIENTIPASLVFEHDFPQRLELAGLHDKCFLHYHPNQLTRPHPAARLLPRHLPDDAILARHGSKIHADLVFVVPTTPLSGATLHYIHDRFGPLELPLTPSQPPALPPAPDTVRSNGTLALAVRSFGSTTTLDGTTAPPDHRFAVVTLTGRGALDLQTSTVALHPNTPTPSASTTFPYPFEYFDATLALNLVADGDTAYAYEPARSSPGAASPVFLPSRWCDYRFVFTIPESSPSLAIEALFGRMGLGFEHGSVPPPLLLPLTTTPPPTPSEPDAVFSDTKARSRFDISLSSLSTSPSPDPQTTPPSVLITATVRVTYHGAEPARDAVRRRFSLVLDDARRLPSQPAALHPPLPELSFAPSTTRRLDLAFSVPQNATRADLVFSGPGAAHSVPLTISTTTPQVTAGTPRTLTDTDLASLPPLTPAAIPQTSDASGNTPPPLQDLPPAWREKQLVTTGSPEAALVARTGDIDNFGFGWPVGFDPLSGSMTKSHPFPFSPAPGDPPGTDRIMVGSGYDGRHGFDGYSLRSRPPANLVTPVTLTFTPPPSEIHSASLQMFLDDFQPHRLGSRFEVSLDGQRSPRLEETINALNQTGLVGKLVTVQVPEESLHLLDDGQLRITFDDPDTGVGDGFAIDFIRLLINPSPPAVTGTVTGVVTDTGTGRPLAGALVSASGSPGATSRQDGTYTLSAVPAGLTVVTAALPGYQAASQSADLLPSADLTLHLSLSPESVADSIRRSGRATIRGVTFDSASAVIQQSSAHTLAQALDALRENSTSHFRIEGHTDSRGDTAYNLGLSRQRAAAVVAWLVGRGIDPDRLSSTGFGESRPVADNTSPTGQALNRRVEIIAAQPRP